MSLFQKEFLAVLEADENQAAVTADTAAAEQAAMQQQLDPTTDPKALDANAPQGVDQARAGHNAAQKKILGTWIQKVAEFVEFLNGVTPTSVQSQLFNSSCDTLFERISTSEKKRISRVAMELSSFNESLKGYLISGDES
jgi:hypothetical protein